MTSGRLRVAYPDCTAMILGSLLNSPEAGNSWFKDRFSLDVVFFFRKFPCLRELGQGLYQINHMIAFVNFPVLWLCHHRLLIAEKKVWGAPRNGQFHGQAPEPS